MWSDGQQIALYYCINKVLSPTPRWAVKKKKKKSNTDPSLQYITVTRIRDVFKVRREHSGCLIDSVVKPTEEEGERAGRYRRNEEGGGGREQGCIEEMNKEEEGESRDV